ncbi:MAG: HEAT repeat domain-containing protein [Methanomicrobiales archaeon]|nr:HEAT repeat domain-containing protein [Methanomicrobiales archaeon]
MRFAEPVWSGLAIITLVVGFSALFLTTGTTYTDAFYLALILTAFWYRRHAVYAGILLAALHVGLDYPPGPGALVRAAFFIAIAYLLGYLFDAVEERPGARHLRISEPGLAACDRDTMRLIARLSSRDPETRYHAAGCLGDARETAAVEPLAALLADPESGVRWKAAEALGKLGSPAVGPLAASLKNGNVDVRWMAAVALGDIADPAAIPALAEALNDEDAYVRSRSALALAAIGKPTEEMLITSLSTGSERVRWGAALALGRIGGAEAIGALIGALHDPGEDVRRRAVSALRDAGEEAVPALVEALRAGDPDTRQGVTAALSQIGKPAVSALIEALQAGEDPEVCIGAALALGRIGDPAAVDALIGALNSDEEGLRLAAREALGGIRKHNLGEGTPELHD